MAAINDIAAISNVDLWNYAREMNPTFKSHTAKATAEMFTERGFEALKLGQVNAINEFTEISLRIGFQMLKASRAKNPLEDKGLVQFYNTPNGGYTQRMAVHSIKPVSPKYKGLTDGMTVDPYTVRKPKADERFFQQNFDYQSFITIQDFQLKTIFISTNGMGEFVAGVMEGLRNGYTIQEYVNTMEALNTAINSEKYPLQDSQIININITNIDTPTNEELSSFILAANDLVSAMTISPQTAAYNAGKFDTAVGTDDLVLLMRPKLKNLMKVNLLTGAIHPENLSLPIPVVEVENFGGLIPYQKPLDGAEPSTKVYPVYNASTGEQIGWSTEEGAAVADVTEDNVVYVDPNKDVIAVVAQKGLIFENIQNPYEVRAIYNPRGLYTNYWASSPNNAINVDPYYNMVVLKAKAD